jgi:hypothetical protein
MERMNFIDMTKKALHKSFNIKYIGISRKKLGLELYEECLLLAELANLPK